MDTVLQDDNDARLGEAHSEHRRLEIESSGYLLFCIVPDHDLKPP